MENADEEVLLSRGLHQDHLKYLQAIFQLIQKVGKEFSIEKRADGTVIFRTLNDNKSVFLSIEFNNTFWSHINGPMESDYVSFACQLSSKTVCSLLRNIKKIEHMNIYQRIQNHENQVVFDFYMQNKSKIMHCFSYQDCEVINAMFNEDIAHTVHTQPKLFLELLEHLHQSPEILIEATPSSFSLRSSHNTRNQDDNNITLQLASKRHLTTDLNIKISEFDVYEYRVNDEDIQLQQLQKSTLVFSTKEFKALLSFCEIVDIPILSLFFLDGGKPMKFRGEQGQYLFRIELTMATLDAPQRYAPTLPPTPSTTINMPSSSSSSSSSSTNQHVGRDGGARVHLREKEEEEDDSEEDREHNNHNIGNTRDNNSHDDDDDDDYDQNDDEHTSYPMNKMDKYNHGNTMDHQDKDGEFDDDDNADENYISGVHSMKRYKHETNIHNKQLSTSTNQIDHRLHSYLHTTTSTTNTNTNTTATISQQSGNDPLANIPIRIKSRVTKLSKMLIDSQEETT